MNKKVIIFLAIGVCLVILGFIFTRKEPREPITFSGNASLRELSIDDKIREAKLIVIGKVNAVLPSRWDSVDGKGPKVVTSKAIFEADLGIFTDTIILIEQILKGDHKEPIIRVRSFIGETEQVRWVDDSQVSYKKGQSYLLFLIKDFGPTANIDPGDYISVNSYRGVYTIMDGEAISGDEKWALDELISYIENTVSQTPTP